MDALSDVLGAIRLTGAVFLQMELRAQWSYLTAPAHAIADVLMQHTVHHVIPYHVLLEGTCLARLLEVLFAEAIRQHMDALPPEETGWLAALRDRYVGRTLALLHDKPAHPWTVDALAQRVGLSRSALGQRFVALIGKPPMEYL